MSIEAVKWALYEAPMLLTEKSKPDTSARQVLVVLAEHADKDGRNARPSVLRIKFATGLDMRTIQRALARLQKGNLIRASGKKRFGCTNWALDIEARRPDSEWTELQAEHELAKEHETKLRQDRRRRVSGTQSAGQQQEDDGVSGTQNPGHPGRSVPASGTEDPGVRDAVPPEPPRNRQEPPPGTTTGGTLPPDPLRPQALRSSEPGTDPAGFSSVSGVLSTQVDQETCVPPAHADDNDAALAVVIPFPLQRRPDDRTAELIDPPIRLPENR